MSLEANVQKVNIEELKNLFPRKEVLYYILQRGTYDFVLPSLKSSGVTINYLLDLSARKVFFINKNDYKHAPQLIQKKISSYELLEILQALTSKPLGFNEHKLPNKNWIIDCIFSLKPSHEIFQREELNLVRDIPLELSN